MYVMCALRVFNDPTTSYQPLKDKRGQSNPPKPPMLFDWRGGRGGGGNGGGRRKWGWEGRGEGKGGRKGGKEGGGREDDIRIG